MVSRARGRADTFVGPLAGIGRHLPLPIPVPDWSKPIILLLLLVAFALWLRARLITTRARGLEGQRALLQRDVDVMQAALVPAVPASLGGLGVSVAYQPADGPAAGGDFYDVFSPAADKVAVVLGDVCGHGGDALTHAALARYTLRAYLQAGLEPRAALALAGRALSDPSGERYATVAVGVYDARTGLLTFASAGHPPPFLQGYDAHEPLTICASPPLGWGVPTGRRQSIVALPVGAVVCFFSDGLIEARAESGLLGRERLGELLAALGPRPLAADLLARVRAVAQVIPDDMAACILTPETSPTTTTPTHIEELELDSEALENVQVRRFLEACRVSAVGIDRAIAGAREIAALPGTVLLRIDIGQTETTVTLHPGGSLPPNAPEPALGDGQRLETLIFA